MTGLRVTLSVLALALLAAGYVASQAAFFNGTATEYAKALDSPLVRAGALALLLLAVSFAFVAEKPEDQK